MCDLHVIISLLSETRFLCFQYWHPNRDKFMHLFDVGGGGGGGGGGDSILLKVVS